MARPATLRRFIPFSCSHAVLPSRPTSNLVNRNLACLAKPRPHGMRHIYLPSPIFLPITLRIVLLTSCKDNRTVLDDHPRCTPRRSQRAPWTRSHSSAPVVRLHEAVPPAFYMSTPVDCLGSVHRTALVALSPTKKTLLCVDCTLSWRRRGNMSR